MILTHPAVSLVAVIGVPHASHGEEIKAYVIPAPGATVTETELVDWCRQNMAAYSARATNPRSTGPDHPHATVRW